MLRPSLARGPGTCAAGARAAAACADHGSLRRAASSRASAHHRHLRRDCRTLAPLAVRRIFVAKRRHSGASGRATSNGRDGILYFTLMYRPSGQLSLVQLSGLQVCSGQTWAFCSTSMAEAQPGLCTMLCRCRSIALTLFPGLRPMALTGTFDNMGRGGGKQIAERPIDPDRAHSRSPSSIPSFPG